MTGARLAVLAACVAAALVRWRLAGMPLERDEGEFAYMGQLILRGEVPYLAAHNMKLPGVYYVYAAILAAFGESDVAIRLGLLAANVLAIVLVYRLGARLLDPTAGAAAAVAYAAWSLSGAVLGLAAKAEHFVVVCALAAALLLTGRDALRRPAALGGAGLWLGLAVVLKQHAAAFVAAAGLGVLAAAVATGRPAWRRSLAGLLAFGAGTLAPFALVCALMAAQGAFEPFWFWTVTYAREYVSIFSLADGLDALRTQLGRLASSTPLWLLAAVGVSACWWDALTRRAAPALALCGLGAVLSVLPGLRFSEHYFIQALPAASLFAGAAVSALARRAAARAGVATALRVALPLAAVALSLAPEADVLLRRAPAAASRALYGVNPFPETAVLADWLRRHAAPGDRLAVIGSEPQVYFYAGLPAATTYIYMYPLMEPHPFARRMQDDMIAQLEQARPRFLALVNVDTSWTRRATSATRLFEWTEEAVNADYTPVALAEIGADATRYRWGAEAAQAPATPDYVVLFERRA